MGRERFQTFVPTRLTPVVAKAGIEGEPDVTVQPAHRIFDAAHVEARS